LFFVLVVLLSLSPPTPVHTQSSPDDELSTADHRAITVGKRLYRRSVFCHGTNGQGDGQVARYVFPKPVISRWVSSRSTRRRAANLSEGERWSLVAYVKTLSARFWEEHGEPIEIGTRKPPYPERIMNGRRLYLDL
jgi:mono/diheme cytochrome c family protein